MNVKLERRANGIFSALFCGRAYIAAMTELLDHAVRTVRLLPTDRQDDLARVLLQLAGGDQPDAPLSREEENAVTASRAAAARGDFASDEEVAAVWAKHGL